MTLSEFKKRLRKVRHLSAATQSGSYVSITKAAAVKYAESSLEWDHRATVRFRTEVCGTIGGEIFDDVITKDPDPAPGKDGAR